jgi:hypothetical protein
MDFSWNAVFVFQRGTDGREGQPIMPLALLTVEARASASGGGIFTAKIF